MNYNLLDKEWIPVFYRDGIVKRVGIRKALEDAHMIRQIAASNPMDRVALLRFLLALLYWCKGNPPDGADSFSGNSFPPDWFKKLDGNGNKDCFNLLGGGKRFYQCTPDTGKKLSANYLVQEIPTGINFLHFKHATEGTDGLCPACCAMGLLRLPLFATSGGRGKSPGINEKPPIYIIPLGSSLAETLLISWRKASNLRTPLAWEKSDLQLPERGEVPLLTGLTWLPRRVWLDNPDESEANCISCGRKGCLIRQCSFAGKGGGQGRVWSDPHIIRDSKGIIKPGNALGASDVAAGQWAKIMAGILRGQKADGKRSLWVVGFATVKNDKYLEAMEYEIHLHSAPDDQKIQESIEKIEKWQKEGSNLVRNARPPKESKASSRKPVEIKSIVDAIRPHVEGKVSAKAGELVAGGDDAWEQAAREYSPMMKVIAKSLSPGFTTFALERRRQIANIMPNMKQKTDAAKKPVRKKGGDK